MPGPFDAPHEPQKATHLLLEIADRFHFERERRPIEAGVNAHHRFEIELADDVVRDLRRGGRRERQDRRAAIFVRAR